MLQQAHQTEGATLGAGASDQIDTQHDGDNRDGRAEQPGEIGDGADVRRLSQPDTPPGRRGEEAQPHMVEAGIAKRQTGSEYLKKLCAISVLEEVKVGREKIFINPRLIRLLTSDEDLPLSG